MPGLAGSSGSGSGVGSGFASSIPQLYLFYGVLAGAGAGTIYPACLPTALKWFPDKSGSISGLVQAGASCGPFIMSPVAQWLISTYGAQMACRILAVIFLIGVGAVAWMIVPCPEGWMPEGWTPTATQAKELNAKNYNIPEMVKTPVFWVMLVMFIFANAAGTMMVSATSPIAQQQIGQHGANTAGSGAPPRAQQPAAQQYEAVAQIHIAVHGGGDLHHHGGYTGQCRQHGGCYHRSDLLVGHDTFSFEKRNEGGRKYPLDFLLKPYYSRNWYD